MCWWLPLQAMLPQRFPKKEEPECKRWLSVQEMLGPLQAALSLGLQYPPLAAFALRALERLEGRSKSTLDELAPAVVPLLEPYLLPISASELPVQGASLGGDDSAEGSEADGKGDADEGDAAAKEAFKRIRAEAETAAKRTHLARFQVHFMDLLLHAILWHATLCYLYVPLVEMFGCGSIGAATRRISGPCMQNVYSSGPFVTGKRAQNRHERCTNIAGVGSAAAKDPGMAGEVGGSGRCSGAGADKAGPCKRRNQPPLGPTGQDRHQSGPARAGGACAVAGHHLAAGESQGNQSHIHS